MVTPTRFGSPSAMNIPLEGAAVPQPLPAEMANNRATRKGSQCRALCRAGHYLPPGGLRRRAFNWPQRAVNSTGGCANLGNDASLIAPVKPVSTERFVRV